MSQVPLSDNIHPPVSERLFIKYDGSNEQLLEHKIDALAYASSIKGYSIFTSKIIETFLGRHTTINLVAHKEGSFGDILDAIWQSKENIEFVFDILDFCGIDIKTIKKHSGGLLVFLQNAFIKLITDHDGVTESIVKKIQSSTELTNAEKETLISLAEDDDTRKSLDEFTSPLDKNGYNNIVVSHNGLEGYKITSSQRPAFKYTPPDITNEEEFHEVVSIVYISPDLTLWQFKGTRPFWAEITDKDFLNKTKDITPSDLKGRFYSVIGTKITTTNNGKIKGKTKYTITKATEVPRPLDLL
ncbi:hypothetical protein [Desulfovibrio sp.]|uniref:hypothetical protein n=1 Tax=Desulfovibrio sp. TaxID=885 RepID=UPI003D119016